jgi:hypothetical protein
MRIFGPKRQKWRENGDVCIMRNCAVYDVHHRSVDHACCIHDGETGYAYRILLGKSESKTLFERSGYIAG